ncbi:MAG: STAS domain-containing protein [Planctomycetota bacterium]|nr:STAS domain-containing protein [Planctomycetota bacterium]
MEILEERHGAVTVVKPSGPIAGEDAARLGTKLAEVMSASLGRFVLDASAVPFVDSKGLEMLLDRSEALQDTGQALRMAGANDTLREVFEITDLAGCFEHFADVNTAVRSFL